VLKVGVLRTLKGVHLAFTGILSKITLLNGAQFWRLADRK
jgi:hypothetical protein